MKERMGARALFAIVTVALTAGLAADARAGAQIVVINADGAGEGFNDPTPAAPVGGNPGTTLGQQRLIAFQHAANLWGLTLDSNIQVRVQASFDALGANVLGSAGARYVDRNFPGTGPFPGDMTNTWFHGALADKLAGAERAGPPDVPAGFPDIVAQFSSDAPWYLGLDGNHGTQQDLVVVVLHELAHGLGFSTFVSRTTGNFFGTPGSPDTYSRFILDTQVNQLWSDMATGADRLASRLRTDQVVWDGPSVYAGVPSVLQFGRPALLFNAPPGQPASRYGAASFGPPVPAAGLSGDVALGAPLDACTALTNPAAVAGKIALVDRGTCTFVVKVKNAQVAGAIAVLVADNTPDTPPAGLGGVDPTITIPSVRITQALGNTVKAWLAAPMPVNAHIGRDFSQRAGADLQDRPQLYATNPFQGGSSISHFDSIAFRNVLMEPAINPDLTHELIPPYDLTRLQMRDVGWFTDADLDGVEDATVILGSCNTGTPDVTLSTGARLSDLARTWFRDCAIGARNHGAFVSCVSHVTNEAKQDGLITGAQKDAIQGCAAGTK